MDICYKIVLFCLLGACVTGMAQDSTYQQVQISEVKLTPPSEHKKRKNEKIQFIELYNKGDKRVDISQLYLSFTKDNPTTIRVGKKSRTTYLKADKYKLITLNYFSLKGSKRKVNEGVYQQVFLFYKTDSTHVLLDSIRIKPHTMIESTVKIEDKTIISPVATPKEINRVIDTNWVHDKRQVYFSPFVSYDRFRSTDDFNDATKTFPGIGGYFQKRTSIQHRWFVSGIMGYRFRKYAINQTTTTTTFKGTLEREVKGFRKFNTFLLGAELGTYLTPRLNLFSGFQLFISAEKEVYESKERFVTIDGDLLVDKVEQGPTTIVGGAGLFWSFGADYQLYKKLFVRMAIESQINDTGISKADGEVLSTNITLGVNYCFFGGWRKTYKRPWLK